MKESKTLEFKKDVTNTFLKTVSAFANFGGGEILFGIDDSGQAIGLPDPDKARIDIENKINDSISPKPDYLFNINPKRKVLSLKISEGTYKPYLYKGKAYRRSDTATVEVDPVELKRLILEGSNLYYEELACEDNNLSFRYFESKLREKLSIKSLNDDILRTLGFYTADKKYNIAASLFSDRNKFSGIDIARFGDTISEILDRETISRVSVLEQYDKALTMFRRYYQYEKIEGAERNTIALVPEEAFREALANAIVHRNWDVNSHIRISMFPDKIEITSPGGLPRGITEEEYLNDSISNLRNPIIGNVFFRLKYIEMFGTGIRRIKESYASSPVKPHFYVTDNTIQVVLPCIDRKIKATSAGNEVLGILGDGSLLSGSEIAQSLSWSKDKTIRELNKLLKSGYIRKVGTGRGTKYAL